MARKKKTRRITDVMPIRKADKKPEIPNSRPGKKLKIRKNENIKV